MILFLSRHIMSRLVQDIFGLRTGLYRSRLNVVFTGRPGPVYPGKIGVPVASDPGLTRFARVITAIIKLAPL